MQTPYVAPSPIQTTMEAPPEFTPMPLRARGVLETLDLSIKVFRRYAGVLLAWSALIIGVCGTVGIFGAISAGKSMMDSSAYGYSSGAAATQMASLMLSSLGAMSLSFFCFPLIIGAAACCVAGAVRGQRIRFSQCWSFTKPRYWSMLGQTLLAILMLWVSMIGVIIVIAIVAALGVAVVTQLPGMVAVPLGIIVAVCFYAGFFVLMMLAAMWIVLVPVVVCMEQNNRGSNALGRAMSLLRGNWRRAAGLMLLVWLGMLIVGGISQAPFAVMMRDQSSPSGALIGVTFVMQMIVWLGLMPFYTLIITLFYLDARVRNEALDLEWSSHTGTPQQAPNTFAPAMTNITQQNMTAQNATAQNATAQNVTAQNVTAQNVTPNFYPQVAHAVSPADKANIARPDAAVWNASTQDLASMPLESFAPQRVAPASDASISNDGAFTSTSPKTTQPLSETLANDVAVSSATSSTGYQAATGSAPPFETTANTAFETPIASGQNAQETAKCPQCGAEVSASQTFCMNCGARLSRPDNAGHSTGFGV